MRIVWISLVGILGIAGVVVWALVARVEPPRTPPTIDPATIEIHNRGVACMGRFDFAAAVDIFEPLAAAHPDWLDCQVDWGIALLNRSRPDTEDLDRALEIMLGVLRRRSDDIRARHCVGVLLIYRGMSAEALPYFESVAREDPRDGYAAYFAGDCHDQLDHPEEALAWYQQARERDPYLRSAWYGTFRVLRALGRSGEAEEALGVFRRLEASPQARVAEIKYTRMGPHALVHAVRQDQPTPPAPTGPWFASAVPLPVDGPGTPQAGGVPAASAADLDGDGAVDLYLPGGAGRPGRVLLRRGARFAERPGHPLAGEQGVHCALFGDVDNDGRVDAYLCRTGPNSLWLQREAGRWHRAGADAAGRDADTRNGALLDVDHDGDLDIVLLHADAPFEVLAGRTDGAFRPLPDDAGLVGRAEPACGLVPCDLDRDRDVDLLVLHADGEHEVFLNDRLWRWHAGRHHDALRAAGACAGVATDADADGWPEITLAGENGLVQFAPGEDGVWRRVATSATGGTRLALLDADGDGAEELLVSDDVGWRLVDAAGLEPRGAPVVGSGGALPFLWDAGRGMAVVAFDPAAGPVLHAPGHGRHAFCSLAFSGRHHDSDQMRSNADGRGVQVSVRLGSRWTVRPTYRRASGPGQSQQPLAIGLAGRARIDFVRLLWSDGLLQTETDLAAGRAHRIEETQRQTSSCPVLFAWDGTRFAFVTDVLGVGGLGFWVAPGTYAPAAPQETVLLAPGTVAPRDGLLRFKLGEPMEETCYLDHVGVEQIDVPADWFVTVDDRMAVAGPAPSGALVFHRAPRLPQTARDQAGRDVRAALLAVDRVAAPAATVDPRFIGRTEEQVLVLTFARPLDDGPGPAWLLADGWIEYPYAQTLFAAWQADAAFEAPTIEARGEDGTWVVVHAQYGYPAGMPRFSAVPLGVLPAGTRALRIRTTQEVYWDRLAVAHAEPCPQARRHACPPRAASLAFAGFARRTTGPQRLPHYDYADRPPLWDARHQAGFHTRFGAVDELVAATDDAVVIFGPGEEVDLGFAAPTAAPPAGWTRWTVVRTTGWCKDMDLFTLDGETVGPLPTRDPTGRAHPARARLHPRYQTRYRSGR